MYAVRRALVAGVWLAACLFPATALAAGDFVTFETGQVRPLALSPSGARLFACNTPDDRLEVFNVSATGLRHVASIPVGLEPAAVAARTDDEVWVVNHLSDSISIVDVSVVPPRVVRTLLVGDEPRDIVFAGFDRSRAFVTAAHRGQNNPNDPQLTTPGVGRADVWVFDATNLGNALGDTPLAILTLFADTPRALTVSPDGATVYAAAFLSGNQSTAVSFGSTTTPPTTDANGVPGPAVGLIVKFNPVSDRFEDQTGRNFDFAVGFSLPDADVFRIDALATPPAPLPGPGPGPIQGRPFTGVGTILFDMAVNPITGHVYVTNGDSHNEVRFEGPGGGGTTVRGHLAEARITILDPISGSVRPRHLNKHIDYDVVPSPAGTIERSLATPLGMAVTPDGATLYVAAFGSGAVGVFDVAQLEADTFTPSTADHIAVTGGGPTGLVLDAPRGRLYVLTRFDDGVSVIDTATRSETQHIRLFNPEPEHVVAGRPFLYDATTTSSNGEAACASCHIFGDFDSLAWDLGNPDGVVMPNPNPFKLALGNRDFHPLKGPMTTQSLRGMARNGPMHWRGDRTNPLDPLDEVGAFKQFNQAFVGLLGRDTQIDGSAMGAFADFILDVTYPPNPIRPLDNSLDADQAAARDFYRTVVSDLFAPCNGCHTLDPSVGAFGTDGFSTFEGETQHFKIPHLRNLYQKIGMFSGSSFGANPQIRGFGFLHDGTVDTVFHFHGAAVFNLTDAERRQMEQFMLAFDSDLAPIVGQQITLTDGNAAVVGPRVALLEERAAAGECDLIVKASIDGALRGWQRRSNGTYRSDRAAETPLTSAQLRALADSPDQPLTFTCAPPGSGPRMGVDRDRNGILDGDEAGAGALVLLPTSKLALTGTSAARGKMTFLARTDFAPTANRIVPPPPGSAGDPSLGGGALMVYNAARITADGVAVDLPAAGWQRVGSAAAPRGWTFRSPAGTGPVRRLKITADRLSVKVGGATWGYSLDEAQQGRIAVRLALGAGGLGWCAEAPARVDGLPPTTARNDRVGRFVGQPRTPPPTACTATPGGEFPVL